MIQLQGQDNPTSTAAVHVMGRPRDIRKVLSGTTLYTKNTIIPIDANGLSVMGFIDSGATISVVSPRLARFLEDKMGARVWPCNEPVEVFEGGKVVLKKRIEVTLSGYRDAGKYVVYVSNQEDLPYDVSIGDDICDMAGMVLNWSSKSVKMFTEVTQRLTRPMIVAKADQLDLAFHHQDFRPAGGHGSRL